MLAAGGGAKMARTGPGLNMIHEMNFTNEQLLQKGLVTNNKIKNQGGYL